MPNEAVIADFSGGMNASVGMDKIADNECLLAENCRFDEQGNLLITGANTLQNTSSLSGRVHSEFIDSFLGAIAGAGTNVYSGKDFSSLVVSTATNQGSSKMSFGAGPNRIYMDLAGVGYFIDASVPDLTTVDWAPPQTNTAGGAKVTGPTSVGTGTSTGTQTQTWTTPNNITSTSTSSTAQVFVSYLQPSQYLRATMGTNSFAINASAVQGLAVAAQIQGQTVDGTSTAVVTMLKNNVPVGTSKTFVFYSNYGYLPISLGGATDLWGTTWTQADINSGNFGFQVQISTNHFTGTDRIFIYKGQITVYQSDATLGFGAGTGAAGTLTGTYTWKITFTAQGGEEGDASNASSAVILSAQQGTLTAIPTGDGRTTGRNIYRKGGTLSSYYLVGNIADNISTTYADNQSDLATLTTGIILAGDTVGDEPNTRLGSQQVRYPCFHYARIFWAVGNLLIWSKPSNGFAYPVDFQMPVGDGKSINGIFSMGGELFIIKPDSIWRLSGTDENSFLLSKTLSPVGTDWPFTAVLSGGTATGFYFTGRILFANASGVWAFNGYTSNKITPKLDLWFRQVNRTNISLFGNTGFNPPEIVNSKVTALNSAAASPLFYYLSYAEAGKTTPTAMLVFDLERGNVTKRPFAAQSLTVDSQGYIYGGNSTGSILKLDDWTASDAGLGAQVNLDFQDKYRDFGLRGSRFALEGMEFLIATNGETVTPYLYFDVGANGESLGTISTPSQVPITVFRKAASANSRYCRNVSLRLNYKGIKANSGNIPNILLVHVKAYFSPRAARARTGENP